MMKKILPLILCLSIISCEEIDDHNILPEESTDTTTAVSLEDIATLLSEVPIGIEQVKEVHDAVSGSSANGYDDEYLMRNLIESPGMGIGDDATRSLTRTYGHPLKELLLETLISRRNNEKELRQTAIESHEQGQVGKEDPKKAPTRSQTRSIDTLSPQEYLDLLSGSDAQIYWPDSENWDGSTMPIITFDPMDGSETNVGYLLTEDGDIRQITVTEEMSHQRPVWIVSNNEDGEHTTLELLRKQDPNWGSVPGGDIVVGRNTRSGTSSGKETLSQAPSGPETRSTAPFKSLVLKDFTMLRNFDSWFAGASEFFCKMGAVESFTASTEAELKLYSPSITDFMIVVKRRELGKKKSFNAVLVSEWTEQLEQCAFMIIEDDGGTVTSWKCSAVGKYESKSYGFELDIPYRNSDDIVWRGSLSRNYLSATSGRTGHFGDVDLTFAMVDVVE